MDATARGAIGWGELPSGMSLRFGQAAGAHRRLKVPHLLPTDRQTTFVPVGTCFDLGIVPMGSGDVQGCSCAALFKENRPAYLVPYLLPNAAEFWVVVRKLAAWVKRVLGTELMYLFVDSDPRWTNTQRGATSFATVDAKLLREDTGIEFRRKPRNTRSLDAENSVQAVRSASNVIVQYMHMNGPLVGSFAFLNSCLVLNNLSKPSSARALLADGTTPTGVVYKTQTDASRLAGPLFSSVTAKIDSTKPGQLRAMSRQGIYVGI